MDYPKISIVTASFNHAAYIEETILSIIDQNYPNLEYIVIDGGSTDGTIDIIKKYEDHITYWVSENDNGLYDALNKGFQRSTGEIMGWLNSDDILNRKSLFVIGEIFTNIKSVTWFQGYPSVIDEMGRIVFHRTPRSSKYAFYLKDYHDGIYIQQESTYWRRSLWNDSGGYISTEYRYAGDFELWLRFYKYAELFCTQAIVGSFRMRKSGQISSMNYSNYLAECDNITTRYVNKLNGAELSLFKKLKLVKNVSNLFPGFARLLRLNKFLDKYMVSDKTIRFDFQKQVFNL